MEVNTCSEREREPNDNSLSLGVEYLNPSLLWKEQFHRNYDSSRQPNNGIGILMEYLFHFKVLPINKTLMRAFLICQTY